MVLEEASDTEAGEDLGTRTGNTGYYAKLENGSRALLGHGDTRWRLDLDSLPRPWGLLGPWNWNKSPSAAVMVAMQLQQAQTALDRPLRQEEVDAVAYNFANSMQYVSATLPISILASAALTYRGRTTFNIPFTQLVKWQWFNPNRIGPIQGQRARVAWHAMRFLAWQTLTVSAAGAFMGSMARSTSMANLMSDPRMKDLKDVIMERRAAGAPPQIPPTQRGSLETKEGRADSQTVRAESRWRQARDAQRSKPVVRADGDDMSPTGGAFMDDFADAEEDGLLSDDQMQMRERQQDFEAAVAARNARGDGETTSTQSQERQQRQIPKTKEQDGVGSPTAPGSSWERLRREAAGRNVGDGSQRQGRDGSQLGQQSDDNDSGRGRWF